MKSENKLNQIISSLNLLESYQNSETVQKEVANMKKLLQEFIIDNSKTIKGSFDMQRYVANDGMRPYLNGVYYDTQNKCAVATDAHIIIVDRPTYDPTIEQRFADQLDANGGITIDKYGKPVERTIGMQFPNYNAVFPTDYEFDRAAKHTITADELTDYITRAKAYAKVNNRDLKYCHIYYKIGDTFFDAKMLLSFVVASDGNVAVHQPTGKNSHACCAIWYSDDRKCLLMPCYLDNWDERQLIGMEEGMYIK